MAFSLFVRRGPSLFLRYNDGRERGQLILLFPIHRIQVEEFMIKAIIFDFDGLILDTESAAFQSWQVIYGEYNCVLPLEKWALCIGTGFDAFNPYAYLEEQYGRPIDRGELDKRRVAYDQKLIEQLKPLPGIEEDLRAARGLGLKVGVASSSSRNWVAGHLKRLGLLQYFDAMAFGNEVEHKKPDPELYLTVLARLEVTAQGAMAIEDSPNGTKAAQRAGIFCVTVPNAITTQLSFEHVDLRLSSLADMPLEELVRKVESMQQGESSAQTR
jgi:HAD superfamily hydrolase (TIGR01509 family)